MRGQEPPWAVVAELPLIGPGGEPVDFRRTLYSHGVAELPPMRIDEPTWTLELTLPVEGGSPRTVRAVEARRGVAEMAVLGRRPGVRTVRALEAGLRHILALDEDLSAFYAAAAKDPDLAWAALGAGRMIRSATVYEEIVKTICTTNCAWSATVRMVGALVEHLGRPAAGAPADGARGRAFPTPTAMADADEVFYREIVRAGYRGAYLRALARSVADGSVDVEALGRSSSDDLSDEEVEARLLALPGVGPYAAAHVMMLIGRYSRLILDSWTRPTYAKLIGRKTVSDAAILRRFKRYGSYAGLAFWLFLTRSWVADEPAEPGSPARA